jgi:hypothetical protein
VLGSTAIGEGWDAFCRNVLEDAGWARGEGVVVDGVRHIEGLETLAKVVGPLRVYLLYVEVDEEVRGTRIAMKTGGMTDVTAIDQHETEIQVPSVLARRADLIVDGHGPVEGAVDRVVQWLWTQSHRHTPTA